LKILENIKLAPYTTFKIGGPARFFCIVSDEKELKEAVEFARKNNLPIFILGGGSNILISDEGFPGLVVKMEMKGISPRNSEEGFVFISAAAGENWDAFVEYVVTNGYYGLENLSAIPGTVGAAAVQNIGAYGADISGTIDKVRALDLATMEFIDLNNAQCHFGYRDSLFKRQKGKYVITKVFFRLKKEGAVNIGYKDLREYFAVRAAPTIQEIREAVIRVRADKLPDWTHCGTAGSFFKNPIISRERFEGLKKKYPNIPHFIQSDGRIKIALGWILDKVCQIRGLTVENVGVYEKQALVIVAKAGATAGEVIGLTNEIIKRVKDKTSIQIEAEVEWVY
jgi:UDP-N-acetylmuramate dehydrogenase